MNYSLLAFADQSAAQSVNRRKFKLRSCDKKVKNNRGKGKITKTTQQMEEFGGLIRVTGSKGVGQRWQWFRHFYL